MLEHAVVNFVHARDQLHQPAQGAHAPDHAHLLQKVGEVETGFLEFLLHAGHVGQLHLLGGLLHQGEHVAHAEDAACHPLGMEGLESLYLLAGADELDRRTAHLADRKGCTAAGVAVELGEHGSCDANLIVEGPGEIGGLLADHRIHHQQHLVGLHGLTDPHHLLHHRRVDLESASGVYQHRVEALLAGLGDAGGGYVLGLGFGAKAEYLHADLGAQGF